MTFGAQSSTVMPGGPSPLNPYFVLATAGQSNAFCGFGAADPILRDNILGLMPFRRSTGALKFTLSADAASLILAAGSTCQLFAVGVSELLTVQNLWWTAGYSDTDLKIGGAPEERDLMFYAVGMAFATRDAYQRGGTGAAATDPRLFPAWLSPDANYPQLLAKAVLNYTAIRLDFGSAPMSYQIGVPAMYPSWFGARGDRSISNGNIQNPGSYLPWNAGVCMAGRDESKKLTMTLTTGQAIEIQSNPASPTVKTGTNTANDGTVYQEVVCVVVGYPVCAPLFGACGIGNQISQEQMIATLRR
jgi:hypothetical protein